MPMRVVHTVAQLREVLAAERGAAFVPTMGNLHEGHLQLVRHAATLGRPVVASIFVNRLQFGAGEDFDRYPRTLQDDTAALREVGADVLFAPDEAQIYPEPQVLFIDPPPEADQLCGAHRPGHFRGVCTVVAKLFNMVQPAVAVFGEKDFQQLWLIRRMVEQLAIPVRIVGHPTARAEDGLALSSRNRYLSQGERQLAPALYRALCQVRDGMQAGHWEGSALAAQAARSLAESGWQVDYLEVRDAATLAPPDARTRRWVVLAAARLGNTRLIDNLVF